MPQTSEQCKGLLGHHRGTRFYRDAGRDKGLPYDYHRWWKALVNYGFPSRVTTLPDQVSKWFWIALVTSYPFI